MNVNKIFILVTFIGLISTLKINAQTTLNLYPISGLIGIKFFSEKKVWLEQRIDFQLGITNEEKNAFLNTEFFTLINHIKNENFNLYTGIGFGANIYNKAQSNFCGSLPLGVVYYFSEKRRLAIIGECGIKTTVMDYLKIKSYASVGLQFLFKNNKRN